MKNIFKRKNKNKNIEIIEPDGGHYTCGGTRRTIDNAAEKTINYAILDYLLQLRRLGFITSPFEACGADYYAKLKIIPHDIIPKNLDVEKEYLASEENQKQLSITELIDE